MESGVLIQHANLVSCMMGRRPTVWASAAAPPLDRERAWADTSLQIAIGRASQPFPRSKPRGPLSRHAAFPLGRSTLTERICRSRPRSAPGERTRRPPSSACSAASVGDHFVRLTRATVTVSAPLPRGMWLRCCRCPPSRVRAWAHPVQVKRCRRSRIPRAAVYEHPVAACVTPEGLWKPSATRFSAAQPPAYRCGHGGLSAGFAMRSSRRAQPRVRASAAGAGLVRFPLSWRGEGVRCPWASDPRECPSMTPATQPACHGSDTAPKEQHLRA